jgi:guanylate kinase
VDYHFRAREQVEELRGDDRFVVLDVRGDLQALDLDLLTNLLGESDAFFEGNPFVGRALQTHPRLRKISRLSVFLSPLSREEILYLRDQPNVSLSDLVTEVMRRKLLARTRRQKKELSLKDLENIERRASSAYRELRDAHYFEYVIANHDGEDSDNWDGFYYPLGDARKSLNAFVALLEGETPAGVEHWESDLLP